MSDLYPPIVFFLKPKKKKKTKKKQAKRIFYTVNTLYNYTNLSCQPFLFLVLIVITL